MLLDPGTTRAILIGSAHYEADQSDLEDLPAVTNNLRDLALALEDPRILGLPASHITQILDPRDSRTVSRAVRVAADKAPGALIVYYSGHGIPDEHGNLILSLARTHTEELPHDALLFSVLAREIRHSHAKCRALILDCCYSGLADAGLMSGPNVIAQQSQISGTWTAFSSSRERTSLAPPGDRHTAFTGELVRLLHNGIQGGPEILSGDILFESLSARLLAAGFPRPGQRNTDLGNRIGFARNVAWSPLGAADFIHSAGAQAKPPSPSSYHVADDERPTDPEVEVDEVVLMRGTYPLDPWQLFNGDVIVTDRRLILVRKGTTRLSIPFDQMTKIDFKRSLIGGDAHDRKVVIHYRVGETVTTLSIRNIGPTSLQAEIASYLRERVRDFGVR